MTGFGKGPNKGESLGKKPAAQFHRIQNRMPSSMFFLPSFICSLSPINLVSFRSHSGNFLWEHMMAHASWFNGDSYLQCMRKNSLVDISNYCLITHISCSIIIIYPGLFFWPYWKLSDYSRHLNIFVVWKFFLMLSLTYNKRNINVNNNVIAVFTNQIKIVLLLFSSLVQAELWGNSLMSDSWKCKLIWTSWNGICNTY